MSTNLTVCFSKEIPTVKKIEELLRKYIGEAGIVEVRDGACFCLLQGKPTHALVDVPVSSDDERWFEVHLSDDSLDVVTRMQDDYTRAVASGFQKLCARAWQGEVIE